MTASGPVPAGIPLKYRTGEKLNDEERSYFNGVLDADDMGAAEFEFGAIGDSLRMVATNAAEFVNFTLQVSGKPVCRIVPVPEDQPGEKTVTLHGFCKAEDAKEIEAVIHKIIANSPTLRPKRPFRMAEGLFGVYQEEFYRKGKRLPKPIVELVETKHIAWFDLDNLWFVSKDPTQIALVREMLSIPAAA